MIHEPNTSLYDNVHAAFSAHEVAYLWLEDDLWATPPFFGKRLLIHPECRDAFVLFAKKARWKRLPHPEQNARFLYALKHFEGYKVGMDTVEICYQLYCRSIHAGEWMPVDQKVQQLAWNNKVLSDSGTYYVLSDVDLCADLIIKCLFDHRAFAHPYTEKITALLGRVSAEALRERLEPVCFRFTPVLVEMLFGSKIEQVVRAYNTFIAY